MKYKLIVFDFDGTLADTFGWFVTNIRLMAEKYNFKNVNDDEITKLRSNDAKYMMKYVGFPNLKLPLIASQMRNKMNKEINNIKLFPGIPETLNSLSEAELKLSVVSSNSTRNVKQVLGKDVCDLIDHFECGVSMFGKESKLTKAVKKCNSLLVDSIYIADELRDIDAAHKLGMAFGAVSWGYTNAEALKKKNPEIYFETVSDICKKLTNEI